MTSDQQVAAPAPGQLVTVRNRQWVAADVSRGEVASTTGPDVWTRFFDLRRCQPGVPGDQAFLLDLAL